MKRISPYIADSNYYRLKEMTHKYGITYSELFNEILTYFYDSNEGTEFLEQRILDIERARLAKYRNELARIAYTASISDKDFLEKCDELRTKLKPVNMTPEEIEDIKKSSSLPNFIESIFEEYKRLFAANNFHFSQEIYDKKNLYESALTEYGKIDSDSATELENRLSNNMYEFIQSSTHNIYHILKEKVYKQDDYCKKASVILYNHVHGVTSNNIISGPSGCGKTYLWEVIRDYIYPNVEILDGTSVTKAGFKGLDLSALLAQVAFEEGIIVIDEFDKLIAPSFTSEGENVSRNLQAEFLKILDDGFVTEKRQNGECISIKHSTKKITFVLCGSFADKAENISEKDSSKTIGFGAVNKNAHAYDTPLTLEDMIEFGLIREIASRIVDVISVKPLYEEDYIEFIKNYSNSAIAQIEKEYGINISLSDESIKNIAHSAYNSSLGLRKVINLIKSQINEHIFTNGGVNKSETVCLSQRKEFEKENANY